MRAWLLGCCLLLGACSASKGESTDPGRLGKVDVALGCATKIK